MYIFGAGGHAKVIAEIVEDLNIHLDGFIDTHGTKNELLGYSIFNAIPADCCELIIAIGNNSIRQRIAFENDHFSFKKLVHPRTSVSKRASIEKGTVVMPGVSINSEAKIGKHCILNTNASIDHECVLQDFVHISPNVALAGNVEVGEGSHVGIGASVIQGVKIGKWCTIGAGSVIIRDVPNYAVVVGNPGRIIKYNK